MANNAQSTPPRHELGPPLSLDHGASNFILGEYVLVRIPQPIEIDGQLGDEVTAATGLPPTSNGSSPQHFAFIRQVNIQPNGSLVLEVYPVLSFSSGGPLAGDNQMDDSAQATLLPLPPLSSSYPTPEAFGAPLVFGNWSTYEESWLSVVPIRFVMPTSRPFIRMNPPLVMPFSVIQQIDLYRETLRPKIQTTEAPDGQDKFHPTGGPSVTSSPTIIRDSRGTGTEQEQFAVKTSHGFLVLEGVDEDAEGADATMKEELMMLARDSPIWMKELKKYLQEEEKEQKQVQAERALRLARWREDITK